MAPPFQSFRQTHLTTWKSQNRAQPTEGNQSVFSTRCVSSTWLGKSPVPPSEESAERQRQFLRRRRRAPLRAHHRRRRQKCVSPLTQRVRESSSKQVGLRPGYSTAHPEVVLLQYHGAFPGGGCIADSKRKKRKQLAHIQG